MSGCPTLPSPPGFSKKVVPPLDTASAHFSRFEDNIALVRRPAGLGFAKAVWAQHESTPCHVHPSALTDDDRHPLFTWYTVRDRAHTPIHASERVCRHFASKSCPSEVYDVALSTESLLCWLLAEQGRLLSEAGGYFPLCCATAGNSHS
jgi:hypothetical protein